MFWRLHKAILGDRIDEAVALLRPLGDSVQVVEGTVSTLPSVPFEAGDQPALALTTLQDAKRNRQAKAGAPWLYFDTEHYNVAYWMPRLDSSLQALNQEGVFLPVGMLQRAPPPVLSYLAGPDGRLFIRPDSGLKPFTGFTLPAGDRFAEELARELQFRHLDPQLICLVAAAQPLLDTEWRFWIVNREVVAHSPYAWESDPEWRPAPEPVAAIARAMAANRWQPDIAYVVDVVTTAAGRPVLNEINAASTSGLYAAPMELLLALREAVQREAAGQWCKEAG